VTLLRGMLDEPLLLTRKDGQLRCLSNVCTHRGKILVERSCKADLIRCGYHGRRFDLEGKFLSMPEFADVADFPSEADHLSEVALATAGDHLFASLDPAVPFEEFAEGALSLISEAPAAELKESREYHVDAHWALYCENYLEGFHIPFVHRSLNEIVDYGTYKTETFRYTSLQTGYDAEGQVAGKYLFIFPNTMFNLYPWGISVNIVEPLSPSRTRVRFLTYVSNDSKLAEGAGADLHSVELEDEAVVESVQRGIRSRFYSHGRYSPSRETGTHHFHRLIAEFMGDGASGR
jgi:choline monooxygenase